ncbi:MAG: type II toxin-antitoxin system VapC family toxin [Gemmataceae bacterium]
MFTLDTDILTLLLRGHEPTSSVARRKANDGEFVITVVNRAEVLGGRFEALIKVDDGASWVRAYERLVQTEVELAKFPVLPVTTAVSVIFDRLLANKKVKKPRRKDLLIACIALAHDAALVTRNLKDFQPIPNLKLENWAG